MAQLPPEFEKAMEAATDRVETLPIGAHPHQRRFIYVMQDYLRASKDNPKQYAAAERYINGIKHTIGVLQEAILLGEPYDEPKRELVDSLKRGLLGEKTSPLFVEQIIKTIRDVKHQMFPSGLVRS